MKRQQGFGFIELMATLVVMAILVELAWPVARLAAQRQREQALRTALMQIRTALDQYRQAVEAGWIAVDAGQSGYPPSLELLVQGVPDQRSEGQRKLYFLRALPPDPMAPQQSWGLRSYASPPDAPLAGEDVFDIYSQAAGSGLNGVPYRQW